MRIDVVVQQDALRKIRKDLIIAYLYLDMSAVDPECRTGLPNP
jgi:hypothetical protein